MLAIAPGCELEVERGPELLFVRVHNHDLAQWESPPLAERIWRLLEQHFTDRLVLELDDAGVLSSSLIGELVELYRRIEEHDGVMRLCGLSPDNLQLLHACRLAECWPAYSDRHEAVMASASPSQPR
jgi:anti-anti-sigma factor